MLQTDKEADCMQELRQVAGVQESGDDGNVEVFIYREEETAGESDDCAFLLGQACANG